MYLKHRFRERRGCSVISIASKRTKERSSAVRRWFGIGVLASSLAMAACDKGASHSAAPIASNPAVAADAGPPAVQGSGPATSELARSPDVHEAALGRALMHRY
jgi:hypothetical protein